MKRNDLRVGQEYLVHDSNDWATGRAYSSPRHVIVLDTRTWDQEWRFTRSDGPKPTELQDGTTRDLVNKVVRKGGRYVLTVLASKPDGQPTLTPVAKIRGTWADAAPIHDAAQEKVRAERAAKRDRDNAIQARQDALRKRVQEYMGSPPVGATMSVNMDALEALLDQAGA